MHSLASVNIIQFDGESNEKIACFKKTLFNAQKLFFEMIFTGKVQALHGQFSLFLYSFKIVRKKNTHKSIPAEVCSLLIENRKHNNAHRSCCIAAMENDDDVLLEQWQKKWFCINISQRY